MGGSRSELIMIVNYTKKKMADSDVLIIDI